MMAVHSVQKFGIIDQTRALAVALVVWIHSHQEINGLYFATDWVFNFGAMGVQLFFLASAFTLCHSMASRGDVDLGDFYMRRFFRIAPLYYIAIVFYFVWRYGLYVNFDSEEFLNYDAAGIVLNFLFLNGFSPFHQNFVVPGGWSIAAEFAFYAVFPFLYRYMIDLKPSVILAIAIGLTVCSAGGQYILFQLVNSRTSLDLSNDQSGFFYFIVFNQFPVFILGMYVYAMRERDVSIGMALLGALLIAVGFLILNDRTYDTSVDAAFYHVVISAGFAFILIWAISRSKLRPPSSDRRFATLVEEAGRRSFSIYIFHFAVLDVVRLVYNRIQPDIDPNIAPFLIFAVVLVVTYWVAGYSVKYIENPGVALGKRLMSRGPVAANN